MRVLRYNLDGPETLPLLVDMHGGGFILGHAAMDDPFMPKIARATGVKILSVDDSWWPVLGVIQQSARPARGFWVITG